MHACGDFTLKHHPAGTPALRANDWMCNDFMVLIIGNVFWLGVFPYVCLCVCVLYLCSWSSLSLSSLTRSWVTVTTRFQEVIAPRQEKLFVTPQHVISVPLFFLYGLKKQDMKSDVSLRRAGRQIFFGLVSHSQISRVLHQHWRKVCTYIIMVKKEKCTGSYAFL